MSALMMLALGVGVAGTPPALPSVSNASAALNNGGSCPTVGGTPTQAAIVRLTWTVTNADSAHYTTSVFKDGVLLQSGINNASTTNDYTVTGYVDHATPREGTPEISPSWVFRVDVIKTADGSTVSSTTAPTYTNTFGTCNGPA